MKTTITMTTKVVIEGAITEDDLRTVQSNMKDAVERAYFNRVFEQDTEVEIETVVDSILFSTFEDHTS